MTDTTIFPKVHGAFDWTGMTTLEAIYRYLRT